MKKIGLLFLGLLFSSTFAQSFEKEPRMVIDEGYSYCEYSDSELDTLHMVMGLFEQHSESRIVQKLYTEGDVQDLVRIYLAEYLTKLQGAIDVCETGERGPIDSPRDYQNFEIGLKDIAIILSQLKQRELKKSSQDPVAESFDAFRNMFLGDYEQLMQSDSRVEKISKALFAMQMKGPDVDANVGFTIDSNSIGATDASALQAQFNVGGKIDVMAEGTDIATNGNMSAEMKIVDGNLYIKLQNFDIDLGDITFENQYDAEGFNSMLAGVKVIQGKYIEIPLFDDTQGNPFVAFGDIATTQEMVLDMLYQDWLTTYSIDGDTIYAGMNPIACGAMQDTGMISDCLESWLGMLQMSGSGILFMQEQGGITSMGIVPAFAAALQDDSLEKIAGVPLISWNDEKLLSMNIPLYEDGTQIGNINYNNNKLSVSANIESKIYDYTTGEMKDDTTIVDISGDMIGSEFDILGSITSSETDVEFTVLSAGALQDMSVDVHVKMEQTNEIYPMNMIMSFSLDQITNVVNPVLIEKPEEWEMLDLEALSVLQ